MSTFAVRAAERQPIFAMADLRFEKTAAPVRVAVRNVSADGMMVEREGRVRRGARVAVEMRTVGAVAGVVVWVRAPLFGIAFERPIDPEAALRRTR